MRVMLVVFVSAFFWMRNWVRKAMVKYQIKRARKQTCAHCAWIRRIHRKFMRTSKHSQNCYSGWVAAAATMIYLSVWLWLVDHLYEWWFALKMIISSFITSLKLWFTFFERFGCFAAHTLNALHRLCVQSVFMITLFLRNMKKHYDKHTQSTQYWFGKFIAIKTITKLYNNNSNITRSEASNAWNNRESGTREKTYTPTPKHTSTPHKMWNNNYNWFWRCCFAFQGDLHFEWNPPRVCAACDSLSLL